MKRKRDKKLKTINQKKHASSNEQALTGKTLLVVNTGFIKKKFIFQILKKLGLTVICLNREKNWAAPYVDHWILADTYNHKESLQEVSNFILNNRSNKIDGVVTFWEDDVLLTAKIVDKFNFIGIPYHVAKKVRNKFLFREFCQANGIPTPRHHLIRSNADLGYVLDNLKFPLVIKPAYGSQSNFVTKVSDRDELFEWYSYIKKNISTNIESALADGLDIFVEEYIDGDEVDIDLLIQNGKVKFYSISDNYNKERNSFFYDSGQAIPSNLPQESQRALIELAEEALEKLGVQHGCVHFEAKSTPQGAVPIEINLRMGGDYVYSYIRSAWNVDLIEENAKIAVGQYIKVQKPEHPYKYIIGWDLFPDDSGILVQLDISDRIRKRKYLEQLEIYKKIGEPVLVQPDGFEYVGWLTVSGRNAVDAQDNLNDALRYIKYKVVKFDPASSIGKTSRKHRYTFASLNRDTLIRAAKIERIRRVSSRNVRKLHVGIACNIYEGNHENSVEQDLMSVGKNIEETLLKRDYKVTFFDFNKLPKTFSELSQSDIDIVFNVCERINDSSLLEPHSAAVLDSLQIPYTGSNPLTLAICIDKIRVKKLLSYHDIPTPNWDYVYTMDDEIDEDLRYPLIIKPGNTDNSIGITNESVVTNKKELERQLEKVVVSMGRPALIEEYIEGDEYDVSIIGNDDEHDIRVLPLSRSMFKDMPEGYWHIYPYDAKWTNSEVYDKGIKVQRPPKNISKRLESLISEISLDTYNILDCHDYGRVEVRVDQDGNPYVLELNPNPSININDCVPACAELIGMDYGDFIEEIIKMAIKRYKNRPPYYHLQTNLI